jgi:pimeloyl-ACP methyl ester carboxylesterase
MTVAPTLQPQTAFWTWQGLPIRYQTAGTEGPALLLVHGFGASSDHWRKNIPVLAEQHRVYAVDLLGLFPTRLKHGGSN